MLAETCSCYHLLINISYIYTALLLTVITLLINRPWSRRGSVEVKLYAFLNLGARWDGGQRHAPASTPPGFGHRTVQPVASRCTD